MEVVVRWGGNQHPVLRYGPFGEAATFGVPPEGIVRLVVWRGSYIGNRLDRPRTAWHGGRVIGARRFLLIVAVLGCVVTGCSGSGGATSTSTTTPVRVATSGTSSGASTPAGSVTSLPASTSTTTTAAAGSIPGLTAGEQAVADAYLAAMTEFDRTGATVQPMDPGLPATMVDPMLNHVRVDLVNMRDQGQAARFPDDTKRKTVITAVRVSGHEATVTACSVDDAVVYTVATGAVVNDDVSTADITATMQRVDGVWKLAWREIGNKRAGVQSCS